MVSWLDFRWENQHNCGVFLSKTPMRKSLLLVPILTALSPLASATLTIYEPFNYTAGGTLASQSGGTGFNGGWASTATNHTISPTNASLAYPPSSPLTPQGARLQMASTVTNISASRTIGSGATMNLGTNGLNFYSSALMSIGETGQTTAIQFTDGTNVRWTYGVNAAGFFYASVDPGASSQLATTTVNAQAATTYLVVAYIRTNTGTGNNDEVFIKVYSPTDTIVFPATDNDWDARGNGNSGVTLNQMRILANSPSTAAPTSTIQLDEIRVGTAFLDVTGVIPEPSSMVLSGLALGLGLVRRKR